VQIAIIYNGLSFLHPVTKLHVPGPMQGVLVAN